MREFLKRCLCVSLCVNLALLGAPLSSSAQEDPGPGDQTTPAPTDPEKPPQGEQPPEVPQPDPVKPPAPEATPGQQPVIEGQLLDLDGTTAIPNEQVRVVDKNGTKIFEVTSGPDGKFTLPPLAEGEYVIETRGVRQPIKVTSAEPIRQLKILVPAAAFTPAGPAAVSDDDDNSSVLIIVGVGVAVIVAGVAAGVAIAVTSGDDGDDKFVGPSSNEGPTAPGVPATSQPPPGTTPAPIVREVAFAPGTSGSFGATSPGQNPAIPIKVTNSTGSPATAVGSISGAGFGFLPGGSGGTGSPARTTAEVGRVAPALTVPGQTIGLPGFGEVTFWAGFEGTTPGTFTGQCTITVTGNPGTTLTLTLTVVVNNTGPFSAYTP